MDSKKILFLINEDWYFISHKLPIAIEAQQQGMDVVLACRFKDDKKVIEKYGIKVIPISLKRENTNPGKELVSLIELYRILKNERPQIIHNFTIKHILYGSIISRILGIPKIINSFSGMGVVFINDSFIYKALKAMYQFILKIAFRSKRIKTIVQNQYDYDYLISKRITKVENTFLIKGSGIDVDLFKSKKPKNSEDILKVAFASRLIWDKGVKYFIEAAKNIHKIRNDIEFILMGRIDNANPYAISKKTILQWVSEGIVRWDGHVSDMHTILNSIDIIILPTIYGEGVPKILIEAASCEIPIIATDWPGCREIVKDGINGILVKPKNVDDLVNAIIKLADSKDKRGKMGAHGRQLVLQEFTQEIVNEATMKVYKN